MRLSTGCNSLDSLLGGGIESGIITEFFGKGGSGKSNICLQLAKNIALKDKKSIYIDTEGVSIERLEQISGKKSEKILKNTLFFRAHSFSEQGDFIQKSSKLVSESDGEISLVIVDCFTVFYRTLLNKEGEEDLSARLGRQLIELMKIARKEDIPVVITTQVYESDDGKRPVGGHILYHNAKTITLLKILNSHLRKGVLKKHRSQPEGKSGKFKITEKGIVTPG
ncbi:MAG: DNA repair and recombination protein RadB [Candidatus Thermoplasmatota archaeon]|nr:DNA repair and recombination protein RadB [Candidatus Thermoplasmatota archaeon]